jgi:hypothetical protein
MSQTTKDRLQAVKNMKENLTVMELDARYLTAKANIAKAQFDEMEATIKAFEIRDKYEEVLNILREEANAANVQPEPLVEEVTDNEVAI